MKKEDVSITNPDDLNKHLQSSSPVTWIVLGTVIVTMIAFFVWSFVYTLQIKITGTAIINGGEVTLNIKEEDLSKIEVGQTVCIQNEKADIISFNDNGQPVVYNVSLEDGKYTYTIVVREMKPIDFLLSK